LFAMDAKGAAGTEIDALKSRQEYLANLAAIRCAPTPVAPPPLMTPSRAPRAPKPAPVAATVPPKPGA
jgi:hypothetical protein